VISTAYETPSEMAISGALALVMHLLFFALLVVGVAWQKREAAPMVAELWSSLPAPRTAPPPPTVEPKPVPKAEPKPPPKVEPKPEPKPVPKADIAAQEKKEKERKAKEKELAEKKKREQQELAEKKKKEEQAQLEKLKLQQAKEAAEQLAREQDEALKKIAQSQAAAQARLVDEYKRRIAEHIRRKINIDPATLQGNPEVEFFVVVLPGGDVLDVKLRKASGQPRWDAAVERAIRRAQPLPLPPPESGLMREFRELNLKFRPKE
jgi:colicin import membrane protein